MKKIKHILFMAILIGLICSGVSIPSVSAESPSQVNPSMVSDKNLQDTLLTLLTPSIDQAVRNVYGEPKQYDLFNAKIVKIERPQAGGFHFIVTVTIQTFEGAHSPPYGKDRFTFDITPEQTVLIDTKHNDVQAAL